MLPHRRRWSRRISAVTDLLANQAQVYFDGIAASLEYVRTERLRALGVTSATRVGVLPNVPALVESCRERRQAVGMALVLPKTRLRNYETHVGLADPQSGVRLADLGYAAFAATPAEFGNLIAQEVEKWAEVIKFAGLKPD